MNEAHYIAILCSLLGGETEERHYYSATPESSDRYISVDCQTDSHVIEVGLDKRSSLDSIQQALFFAELSGKIPGVVIVDTDGERGIYEHRILSSVNAIKNPKIAGVIWSADALDAGRLEESSMTPREKRRWRKRGIANPQ